MIARLAIPALVASVALSVYLFYFKVQLRGCAPGSYNPNCGTYRLWLSVAGSVLLFGLAVVSMSNWLQPIHAALLAMIVYIAVLRTLAVQQPGYAYA